MRSKTQFLKYVQWSDLDSLFIGFCPDLFPYGGICHGDNEVAVYAEVCEIVDEELEDAHRDGRALPRPSVRPMRTLSFDLAEVVEEEVLRVAES